MRGINFGLRTARDGTVDYKGLAIDLILASHNRDECFAVLFLCFGFDSAELEVLKGLNSSEVSPSAGYRFWPPHRPRRYCGL